MIIFCAVQTSTSVRPTDPQTLRGRKPYAYGATHPTVAQCVPNGVLLSVSSEFYYLWYHGAAVFVSLAQIELYISVTDDIKTNEQNRSVGK